MIDSLTSSFNDLTRNHQEDWWEKKSFMPMAFFLFLFKGLLFFRGINPPVR
jgi:hypothetical protein